MKIRIAKKILFSECWRCKWEAMRPEYYDEEHGYWVSPSWHDIPDHRFQKARRIFLGSARRYFNRHGKCYDEKGKPRGYKQL